MTRSAFIMCSALAFVAVACDGRRAPSEPSQPSIDAQLRQSLARWGVIPIGPMPTQDPALVALGQVLFFDKILSGNKDISCGTCHDPATHAGDGLSLAIGTGGTGSGAARTLGEGRAFVPRNAPTLLNAGLGLYSLFWDGRLSGFGPGPFPTPDSVAFPPGLRHALEAQAMLPVLNRREMRGDAGDVDVLGQPNELAAIGDSQHVAVWQAVMRRLLAIPGYVGLFNDAFPGTSIERLGFQHAATAIAAFQMEVLTKTGSRFDRYLARDDAALTAAQKRGALLFFGEAPCGSCHNGPFLGGQGFANVGAPQLGPGIGAGAPLDFGFGEVIEQEFYRFAFRVAPLRNVELTAPYMHDGAYATLEAVVRHYDDVPEALRNYDVSQLRADVRASYHGDAATLEAVLATLDGRLLVPLDLTEGEIDDLVAFLESLTDPAARDLGALVPATVPSGLSVRD